MVQFPQLARIQERARRRQYRLTGHAEHERESDKITIEEIEEALLFEGAEVIENYADDPRGRSCLVLGFTKNGEPVHVVCGLGREMLIVITVYRPNPGQWINWRARTAKIS